MQFKVRDWMVDLIVFVDPDSSVSDALALMRRRYIHSLIVQKSQNNTDYGIVTSTDINDKIVALDCNPSTLKVRDIMTSPIATVNADQTLKECALTMKEMKIHHLPVVDAGGNLIGMISATGFLVAAEAMGREPGDRLS
jgi:CBS domain-containing protein